MPPALGFQSGRRCGSAETCSARCSRRRRYARSMSLTMIARCWNERSLLRASGGIGRPRGARNFRQLDRLLAQPQTDDAHAEPEDALEALVVLAATSTSDTGSNPRTSVKKRTERSMSDTVIPTESIARTSALPARAGAGAARASAKSPAAKMVGRLGDVPHRIVPVSGGDVEVMETP